MFKATSVNALLLQLRFSLCSLILFSLLSNLQAEDFDNSLPSLDDFIEQRSNNWTHANASAISITNFKPDAPSAIALPRPFGQITHYNYWTFQITYKPLLESLARQISKILPQIEESDPTQAQGHQDILNIIEEINQEKPKFNLEIALYADNGQRLADIANPQLRALVESSLGTKLYTTDEISKLDNLKSGDVIKGIAIFPPVPPEVINMELRVYGPGVKGAPEFQPGELFHSQMTRNPEMYKVFRFFYKRSGSDANVGNAPIQFLRSEESWLWNWAVATHVQAPRKLDVTIGVAGDAQIMRHFYAIPFSVINRTARPQKVDFQEAGLNIPLNWHGLKYTLKLADPVRSDNVWIRRALNVLEQRRNSNQEYEFVSQYEISRNDATNDLDDSDELSEPDTSNSAIVEEINAKSSFPLLQNNRLPKAELASGQKIPGLLLIPRTISDISTLTQELVQKLIILGQLTSFKDDNPDSLIKLYKELPIPEKSSLPENEQIVNLLVATAKDDLEKAGIILEPAEQDDVERLYGKKLWPIAVLILHQVDQHMEKRLEAGFVEPYFKVETVAGTETGNLPWAFREPLPDAITEFHRYDIAGLARQSMESVTSQAFRVEGRTRQRAQESEEDEDVDITSESTTTRDDTTEDSSITDILW